jgi:hypothetical protein
MLNAVYLEHTGPYNPCEIMEEGKGAVLYHLFDDDGECIQEVCEEGAR